jgi:prolyl-tRNA synthetase
VRPTSETIIWHSFAKWIQSYRDLPLLANQWANVLRWEMRPRPFLRSAEFLWQEGHTAHADAASAKLHSENVLNTAYAPLCRDVLALPFYSGTKSATERFRCERFTRPAPAECCDRSCAAAPTIHSA